MPLRAKPFAPHCAIPTPCPQPRPVTTKTGWPAVGSAFTRRGFRASTAPMAKPAIRKPQMTPAVRASARDMRRRPDCPRGGCLRLAHDLLRKAVSLHGFHGMSFVAVRLSILPQRYTDVEHIARGGMGDVYRATDTTLGRTVAVKVLAERYADAEDVKRRFKNEALAAARLSGAPYTVTIFDVGEANGQAFIVMEYLEGGSLEQQLQAGKPDTAAVIRWLQQAAAAIDAGHAAGVVHRDVKPGNLLLDGRGDVHVADFGVASAVGLDSLTITGTVLGTAGYLSPEQAQGQRATPASDRYALGVVAWELLHGRRPFESDSPTAEAAAHVNAPIPSSPPELDPVFQRALAKDPNGRYPSAGAFVSDLRRALEPPTQEFATPVATRRRGHRTPLLLLLALLLLGGGIAMAAVMAGRDEPETRTVVQRQTVTREGETVTTNVTVTTA